MISQAVQKEGDEQKLVPYIYKKRKLTKEQKKAIKEFKKLYDKIKDLPIKESK